MTRNYQQKLKNIFNFIGLLFCLHLVIFCFKPSSQISFSIGNENEENRNQPNDKPNNQTCKHFDGEKFRRNVNQPSIFLIVPRGRLGNMMLGYSIILEFNGRLLIFILKVVCWKVSISLKRGQFHNSKPYTLHSLRKCETENIIYSRENYPKLLLPNCKLGITRKNRILTPSPSLKYKAIRDQYWGHVICIDQSESLFEREGITLHYISTSETLCTGDEK